MCPLVCGRTPRVCSYRHVTAPPPPPPPHARAVVPPAGGPILDPDEPEAIQKLRREIHTVRVSLIRAAQRLGYDHENGLVKQVGEAMGEAIGAEAAP
jgi:hypothetical protein